MNRDTRLQIKNLSYVLALIFSAAYYLSSTLILNITNPLVAPALITAIIVAFPSTRDILEIILGKAMGFSPTHFTRRYQTTSPFEKSIVRLINECIPHLHCLIDIIIEAPLKKEYSEFLLEIIKEALENTAIHSRTASHAEVNFFVDHRQIKVFLQDNGEGFCIFSLTHQHKGLKKIQRLTQRMGGTHRYETDNTGTAHWIEIPLKN